MILVDLDSVSASRPDKPLFADLSLTISTGDRVGVVGINGCGKSTLLRVIAGAGDPEAGVVRRGRGVRVAFLDQRPELPAGTVRAAVGEGWEAAAVLDRLGMGGLLDADVATLSGGQAKRVALARALVAETDLLVLDEPTNHLDIDAIAWLEDRLAEHRGGVVLVTHDRHVLDRVTTVVLEIDRGRAHVHDGGYDAYLEGRAAREERAAAEEAVRRNLARQELGWLRRGAPARRRKPQARLDAAKAIIAATPDQRARPADIEIDAALGGAQPKGGAGWHHSRRWDRTGRLGDKVVDLVGVGHRFGGGRPLFSGVDLSLDKAARLGVVGPNGSGKSTLLDIIAGRIDPAEGAVERGPTVRIGYYDQTGRELDPAQRVRDAVAGPGRTPGSPDDVRLMQQFWFEADAQFAPIGTLSGGERRRLQLLLVLAERPNVLLLDEPTNDLDLDTLRALEDFLETWPGAVVAVSHDRAFLERAVDDVLALDGEGHAGLWPGGYAAWEEERLARRARASTRAKATIPRSEKRHEARGGRSAYTLGRLLKEAERELARLERQRDELEASMAVAAGDHQRLAELGTQLAVVAAALAGAEERWLELAAEREEHA